MSQWNKSKSYGNENVLSSSFCLFLHLGLYLSFDLAQLAFDGIALGLQVPWPSEFSESHCHLPLAMPVGRSGSVCSCSMTSLKLVHQTSLVVHLAPTSIFRIIPILVILIVVHVTTCISFAGAFLGLTTVASVWLERSYHTTSYPTISYNVWPSQAGHTSAHAAWRCACMWYWLDHRGLIYALGGQGPMAVA